MRRYRRRGMKRRTHAADPTATGPTLQAVYCMHKYSSTIGLYLDRSLIARAGQHIEQLKCSLSHTNVRWPRSNRCRLLHRCRRGGHMIVILGPIVVINTYCNGKVHPRSPAVNYEDAAPIRRQVVPQRFRSAEAHAIVRTPGYREEGIRIRYPAQLAQLELGCHVLESIGANRQLDATASVLAVRTVAAAVGGAAASRC